MLGIGVRPVPELVEHLLETVREGTGVRSVDVALLGQPQHAGDSAEEEDLGVWRELLEAVVRSDDVALGTEMRGIQAGAIAVDEEQGPAVRGGLRQRTA